MPSRRGEASSEEGGNWFSNIATHSQHRCSRCVNKIRYAQRLLPWRRQVPAQLHSRNWSKKPVGCIEFPPSQYHTYKTTIGDRWSGIGDRRSQIADRLVWQHFFVMRVQWFYNASNSIPSFCLVGFWDDWSIGFLISIDRSNWNSEFELILFGFVYLCGIFRHTRQTWQTGKRSSTLDTGKVILHCPKNGHVI